MSPLLDPCADHSCDGCGWCTGALNTRVPTCCASLPTGVRQQAANPGATPVLPPDWPHDAITSELAGQPSFALLLDERDCTPVVLALHSIEAEAVSEPSNTETGTSNTTGVPTAQPDLPPATPFPTDLDRLQEQIAADRADQPSLSELIQAEASNLLVRRLLASAPVAEAVPVPLVRRQPRESEQMSQALRQAEQSPLPPIALSPTDLLTHQHQRQERQEP